MMKTARSWADIEQLATSFRNRYKFDPDTEQLERLVERLKGQVIVLHRSDTHRVEKICLSIISPQQFKIYLRPESELNEDRVIIGRMLGHYHLHSGEPRGSTQQRFGLEVSKDALENVREANRFACCLLIPKEALKKATAHFKGDETQLAFRFGVTKPFIVQRLKSLAESKG